MLTAINNAFYDSIDVLNGDTVKSGGLKFAGVVKISDVPFLKRMPNVKVEPLAGNYEAREEIPEMITLEQNYPNPFNPVTGITYQLPAENYVTLKVYNMLGEEVATLVSETKPAGSYEAQWDAANIPSGVYYYRMQAGQFTDTKKLILLK